MLDAVLVAMLARLDQARCRGRIVGIDQPGFVGLVIMHVDDDVLRRLGLANADIEADVGLLEHQYVVGSRCADSVPIDRHRPMICVEPHVEDGGAVGSPHDRAASVGDGIVEVPASAHVANADGVEFRALVVDAVGEQTVVRAMRQRAHRPVGLALGLPVAVDQDRFGPAAAWTPADARILAAGDGRRIVVPRTVGGGHRAVVLLDPRLHFLEQGFLQGLGVGHGRFHVGVLGLEIGTDFAVEQRWIAHHLLPVGRPQPGVVVDERDAVMADAARPLRGMGGLGRTGLTVLGHVVSRIRFEGRSLVGRYYSFSGSNVSDTPLMQ